MKLNIHFHQKLKYKIKIEKLNQKMKINYCFKSNIKFIPIQNKSVIVHVCFVLFIFCLCICVRECVLQNNKHETKHNNNTSSKQHSYVRGPLRECRPIRSGASGLPYYCAPLVCISVVIELLAVWRHNKQKPKNLSHVFSSSLLRVS